MPFLPAAQEENRQQEEPNSGEKQQDKLLFSELREQLSYFASEASFFLAQCTSEPAATQNFHKVVPQQVSLHTTSCTHYRRLASMSGRGKGGKGLGKGGAKRHRKVLRDNIQGAACVLSLRFMFCNAYCFAHARC